MTSRSYAYLLSLFHCKLIIIILNPNPSPSLSTLLSYNITFNTVQFFSCLNYCLLPMILTKADFDSNIFWFLYNYLINRQTQYVWNHFTSSLFRADISIGQEFTLSSILSALYIASIFHILEKRIKNLSIPIPIFFRHLLIMVFLFLKKKALKNQIQISFVVIVLFYFISNNLVLLLSIISPKFFISIDWQRTLILLYSIWDLEEM